MKLNTKQHITKDGIVKRNPAKRKIWVVYDSWKPPISGGIRYYKTNSEKDAREMVRKLNINNEGRFVYA